MSESSWTRRGFLKATGAAGLTLSLHSLGFREDEAYASEKIVRDWDYSSWEDLFRREWTWDKVTHGTHLVDCYPGGCSWQVYTREGMVWREEQSADYAVADPTGPDWNPRGCQKGCTYSHLMYNPDRLTHPMKRVGQRGEGKWKRISWDEAADRFADGVLDAIEAEGPESVIFEPGPGNGGWLHLMGIFGLMDSLGATNLDLNATIGDFLKGLYETFGKFQFMDSSDAWYFAKLIIVWQSNPVYTRIPSYHFFSEARYAGAEVIIVAPDYSPSAMHCDEWVPVPPATDAALALGMAQVLIDENLIDVPFVKEQTDFPLLIRTDTERFLRGSDMEEGGLDDQFYFYDTAGDEVVKAPRDTLKLPVDPALEGSYSVQLRDGTLVDVRPSFAIFKELLDKEYTPEKASKICGVHPDTIRRIARKAGRAGGHVLITLGLASPKNYHGDLIERAQCLILALTGSLGKKGCGIGGWSSSGLSLGPILPDAAERQRLDREIRAEDPTLSDEMVLREIEYRRGRMGRGAVPPMFLYYFHSGYKDTWDKQEWHDPAMARSFGEYMREAIDKGWWKGRVRPAPDQEPQAYVFFATNPARKNRGWWRNIHGSLWKKYKFICGIDVKMNTTCLMSDLVLPAAGFYEKLDVRFPTPHIPWLMLTEKAVDPPGEAMAEWDMAQLLAARVIQRAKERGLTRFKSRGGIEYDLEAGPGMPPVPVETLMEMILGANAASGVLPEGTNLEYLRKVGKVRFTRIPTEFDIHTANLATEIAPDEPIVPFTFHIGPKKIPYPTYNRRIQLYLDHEWFIEAREAHPVHKDSPNMGGDYPLRMTNGHQRWSIHSIWVTDTELLKTHQGRPSLFMNPEDAEKRGIEEGDLVRVYNDFDDFKVHVKLSAGPRPHGRLGPGQVIMYHGWEPFQFEDWKSYDSAIPGMIKWNDMAGGYGHLEHYLYNWCNEPVDRPIAVDVERA
jgi:DMSO reductase family type II enzyme molybdopterin subunit